MSIKIHYATLYVADQERSLVFYTKALGFEKRREGVTGGGGRLRRLDLLARRQRFSVCPRTLNTAGPIAQCPVNDTARIGE